MYILNPNNTPQAKAHDTLPCGSIIGSLFQTGRGSRLRGCSRAPHQARATPLLRLVHLSINADRPSSGPQLSHTTLKNPIINAHTHPPPSFCLHAMDLSGPEAPNSAAASSGSSINTTPLTGPSALQHAGQAASGLSEASSTTLTPQQHILGLSCDPSSTSLFANHASPSSGPDAVQARCDGVETGDLD